MVRSIALTIVLVGCSEFPSEPVIDLGPDVTVTDATVSDVAVADARKDVHDVAVAADEGPDAPTDPIPCPQPTETDAFGIQWVCLTGGSFEMGSADFEPREAPPHAVRVRDFWIGRAEVTVGQYRACAQAGPAR